MLGRLLLLFTVVPVVELILLLQVGSLIGTPATIALIIGTAVLGATLAKRQGVSTWRRIQKELQTAQIPGDSLLDGLAVLLSGAFLITPGVFTDIAGIGLLIPTCRKPIKSYIKKKLKDSVESPGATFISGGSIFDDFDPTQGDQRGPRVHDRRRDEQTTYDTRTGADDDEDVIDVTPIRDDDEDDDETGDDRSPHLAPGN